ncbi:MAG: DUF72 domain-containing protein [Pseudomonadota bacterium]|nr:DUF72 domain-containing protein [Pseudomonadota bacterium]
MHAFTTSGPGYCARSLKSVAFSGRLSPKSGIAGNQFPLWFRKNRTTVGYLEQLSERLPYPIAVEFRGGGWMDEDRRKSTLEILCAMALAMSWPMSRKALSHLCHRQ